jgi:uncharacterized protein (UPF0335 family)
MTTVLNAPSKKELMGFISEIEEFEGEKKDIGEKVKAIYAAAKAKGFDAKQIRKVITFRKQKPDQRATDEETFDLYRHAIGMLPELPLFEQITALCNSTDRLATEAMLSAYSELVPNGGAVVVSLPGEPIPVRLWRDSDGNLHKEDHVEVTAPPKPAGKPTPRHEPEVENRKRKAKPKGVPPELLGCTAEQAEAHGAKTFRNGGKLSDNPFPSEDAWHLRWATGFKNAERESKG